MNNWKRDVSCGELSAKNVGEAVTLNGWAHRQRDHGDLVFIDLRDRTGLAQVVVDAKTSPELVEIAGSVHNEYVLSVKGTVRLRQPGATNPNLKTGEIEVLISEMEVLSESKTLPFQISDEAAMSRVDETLRVKYRYLDLRRASMYERLEVRHKAIKLIRDFMDNLGFLEIETPMFTKSTPEGARDYLIPYRLQPGHFYALPQSPQQYKQLLMVGGVERYFQIARCFRDEAQRADRQPEFTQLDVEMSFVEQEDVLRVLEDYTTYVVRNISTKEMVLPFPRMTWEMSSGRTARRVARLRPIRCLCANDPNRQPQGRRRESFAPVAGSGSTAGSASGGVQSINRTPLLGKTRGILLRSSPTIGRVRSPSRK